MRVKRKKRTGKKGFITSVIVDFWAYIIFVLVIIVFAVLYKWTAEAKLQQLDDVKDVTYGNYLSNVYLRMPLTVGTEDMTMAEVISLYDYNQTREREIHSSYGGLIRRGVRFFFGRPNMLWNATEQITDDFVENNFDDEKCFVFSIKGNDFEYVRFGRSCRLQDPFSVGAVLPYFGVPNSTFVTYIPSVDPRKKPIQLFSIYDLNRLVELYALTEFTDMNEWRTASTINWCAGRDDIEDCVRSSLD